MIRKYDDEFKRNAVKKILDGQSVKSVSQEVGVNESQLHKWRRAALAAVGGNKIGAEVPETIALRKRVRELESVDRKF